MPRGTRKSLGGQSSVPVQNLIPASKFQVRGYRLVENRCQMVYSWVIKPPQRGTSAARNDMDCVVVGMESKLKGSEC